MNAVNPEAIGVFGLIVTTLCIGLEQMGFGVKGGDHKQITKSLAYIAFIFGGATQILTAIAMYFFNVAKDPALSIYLGTIFADYGFFWVVVGIFFIKGGDRKMFAHFFAVQFFITAAFTYKAFLLGKMWPLGTVLIFICALFIVLIPAYYEKGAIYTKLAGLFNVLIGLSAIPIFLTALGL